MTAVFATGTSPLASIAVTPRVAVPTAPPQASAPPPSTVLQLNRAETAAAVYDRPVGLQEAMSSTRSWATAPDDAISTLMQRNTVVGSDSLSSRWRGVGGALLTRMAQQPGDYSQTLVLHTGGVQAADALNSARDNAVKVQLRIQTRSGTQVELSIAVNRGANGVLGGLQVEMRASGPLSEAERQALGALAGGFDQALQGLGRADAPRLDLSGLMDYDSRQLSGLSLTVRSPDAADPLAAFNLELNEKEKSVRLQGSAGNLALRLDSATPLGQAGAAQRQDSILQYLAQFDAAAQRGHVATELIEQFKQAFAQLHGEPSLGQVASEPETTSAARNQAAPLLSGLADFEASFDGEFTRNNKNGYLAELGQARYEVSQQTRVQRNGGPGDLTVTQSQSAALQARYLRALGEAELDLQGGNYHLDEIRDQSQRTTSVATADSRLVRAVTENDEQQLRIYSKMLKHQVAETRQTPEHRHTSEDLLRHGLAPARS